MLEVSLNQRRPFRTPAGDRRARVQHWWVGVQSRRPGPGWGQGGGGGGLLEGVWEAEMFANHNEDGAERNLPGGGQRKSKHMN